MIWSALGLWAREARPNTGLLCLVNGISFPFVGAQELVKDGERIDWSYQKPPCGPRGCVVLCLHCTIKQETVKFKLGQRGAGGHSSSSVCSGLGKGNKEAWVKVLLIPEGASLATSLLWPWWRCVLGRPHSLPCAYCMVPEGLAPRASHQPSETFCTVKSI